MQHRNAAHSLTGKSPAELFKSRSLRTNLECIGTADVTFFKGNDLRPSTGVVIGRNGNRMVTVLDLEDLSSHRRHVDQVEFNAREGLHELLFRHKEDRYNVFQGDGSISHRCTKVCFTEKQPPVGYI
ncbi:hypothetical protein T265_06572 [Opisthorchis viverrini]|uniref:Uncharacterized protein n=1 Tax=Opisthorchis viverrini TaxID=6198 RepID=A0A074ZJZ0_OPIVI|nr:hypothetical protein T265_06572 [Opisthorchis viverrini]KER26092.1 hypothetical protein T265_06572 [Opisthorchis viverrini]